VERRVVGERPPTEDVHDEPNNITNDQVLAKPEERGVDEKMRRQVAAALVLTDRRRTQWRDRAKHDDLAHLSAPRFLRAVYPDLLDADGSLTNEEAVRRSDPMLVQMVQGYINKRQGRSLSLGDAKGLVFTRKDNRGRPRKPQVSRTEKLTDCVNDN
jgi:hypothetical protein